MFPGSQSRETVWSRRILLRGAVLLAAALSWRPAAACDFATANSSRWSIAVENGASWLRTPCGDRFYSLGVNILDGGYPVRERDGKTYYSWRAFTPTLEDWVGDTRRRLADWGFNTGGGWSVKPDLLRMPVVINLELGRLAKFHWFDPFSPDTEARMMAIARREVAPYRNSPYRIGYFSDNEVGWWAGALFSYYATHAAGSATKQRWIEMLRRHYGDDWARFAADFLPPEGVTSWDGLLQADRPTRLRPGGNGIAAVREWTGLVAAHYYTLAKRAIRAADPDALYLGDRLPIYYDPAAVRAMAPHVDAIATNYNAESGDGWIAPYFFDGLQRLSGGKPVLVTEWFFAARENRTGNRNNGHLMTVRTQAERARGAAAITRNFARRPEIVGSHWFQYHDHPRGGRSDGEDYNFGLVDIDDHPYEELVAALAEANREAARLHAEPHRVAAASSLSQIVVPHRSVDIHDHSLADWPKPASLLPPLTPKPGAVAFGEVYLSWSEAGLAVATTGQDYYDIDLFAYDGPFPLGDAYRLEIGVDAGAGPRRATLFFIPPRAKVKDHPPMAALLCGGAALQAIGRGCVKLPGAEAVYFGADQPRIAAEMLIPWAALGVAPPAAGTPLRAEVALTSWHRERWASLSGRAPDAALADPGVWRTLRLGDGLAVFPPHATADHPG